MVVDKKVVRNSFFLTSNFMSFSTPISKGLLPFSSLRHLSPYNHQYVCVYIYLFFARFSSSIGLIFTSQISRSCLICCDHSIPTIRSFLVFLSSS